MKALFFTLVLAAITDNAIGDLCTVTTAPELDFSPVLFDDFIAPFSQGRFYYVNFSYLAQNMTEICHRYKMYELHVILGLNSAILVTDAQTCEIHSIWKHSKGYLHRYSDLLKQLSFPPEMVYKIGFEVDRNTLQRVYHIYSRNMNISNSRGFLQKYRVIDLKNDQRDTNGTFF